MKNTMFQRYFTVTPEEFVRMQVHADFDFARAEIETAASMKKRAAQRAHLADHLAAAAARRRAL